MLNLREPYSPFSTIKIYLFALRGTLKANTHFTTTTFEAFALRAYLDIPHAHNHTKSQRPNIPGSHPLLTPLADYNIKVLSINQKLIKYGKNKL